MLKKGNKDATRCELIIWQSFPHVVRISCSLYAIQVTILSLAADPTVMSCDDLS